jgi:hypothetical protein
VVNSWRAIPASMCSANSEIFSRNILGPLVILHINVNMEGYKDILTCCILSMVEDQFGNDDSLYQHDSAPCQKARSVRE